MTVMCCGVVRLGLVECGAGPDWIGSDGERQEAVSTAYVRTLLLTNHRKQQPGMLR